MQNVTVPYGEGSLTFPVDDGIEITRLELNDYPSAGGLQRRA